jgi:hypothetical protein
MIEIPRDRASAGLNAVVIGVQSSLVLGNLNFGAITPTIV